MLSLESRLNLRISRTALQPVTGVPTLGQYSTQNVNTHQDKCRQISNTLDEINKQQKGTQEDKQQAEDDWMREEEDISSTKSPSIHNEDMTEMSIENGNEQDTTGNNLSNNVVRERRERSLSI